MSTSKLNRWVNETPERAREYARESLIVDVSEEIWAALAKANVSQVELAERLGSSKSHVSQLLNGSRNMTLRSLADIAHAIRFKPCFRLFNEDQSWGKDWQDASGVVSRVLVRESTVFMTYSPPPASLPDFVGPRCSNDDWWDMKSEGRVDREGEAALRLVAAAG